MPVDPIIDLSPVDSEGLREDLPPYRRKWSQLTNVIFRDGRLRPRPGLKEPWTTTRDLWLPSVARGVPLSIVEILNPGSNNENRQGMDYAMETLAPNASSDTVAGWTGDHTDIDETVPDSGSTKMTTATSGAKKLLSWSNLSNSPTHIPAVTILCRARAGSPAMRAVLKFYDTGGTLVHTQEVTGSTSSETDDWQVFAYTLTESPAGLPFTVSDINSLQTSVEYAEGETTISEALSITGNGNYSAWKDASDGTTAVYTDYDVIYPWEQLSGETVDSNNGIVPPSADSVAKQSWTFASIENTFSTVSQLTLSFFFTNLSYTPSTYTVFFRTGGTDYTISTETMNRNGYGFGGFTVESTTNPATSAAWTSAQISGGEFGITHTSGPVEKLVTVMGGVSGVNDSATVQIDWMSAHVSEITEGTSVQYMAGRDQIWSTDKAHLRLDSAPPTMTVTDVTNSVALTLPPTVPVDWAILYGQVYEVNGEDATRRYPNGSAVFEALTTNNADDATILTGRTVAAFADRILYGWVRDNTSFTPERVSYSKRFDGDDHSDASAGDFDLLSTPGGVLKLKPLSEDVCVAYKERGIYNIRQSGMDFAPLIPDLIDPFTELIAPRSVVSTITPTGTAIHLFLGTSPTAGLNVYAYDGATAQPVGDGIAKLLREDSARDALKGAFAEGDPEAGLYYLFVPTGQDAFPEGGFVYHIRTGVWTKFTLPFPVSCAGIWTIPRLLTSPATQGFEPKTLALDGARQVMVGTLGGRIVSLDYNAAYDVTWPSSTGALPWEFTEQSSGGANSTGESREYFTCTIETGDPRPNQHPAQQASAYTLNMIANTKGPVKATVSASADSGAAYSTEVEYENVGALGDTGAYGHLVFDATPVYTHRPRLKLEMEPFNEAIANNPRWEIAEMWIQVQPQGDKP